MGLRGLVCKLCPPDGFLRVSQFNYKLDWWRPIAVVALVALGSVLVGLGFGALEQAVAGSGISEFYRTAICEMPENTSGALEARSISIRSLIVSACSIAFLAAALRVFDFGSLGECFAAGRKFRPGLAAGVFLCALVVLLALRMILFGMQPARYAWDADNGLLAFGIAAFLLLVALLVAQSVAEECLYRGFLMKALYSWVPLKSVAILMQAAIFAGLHVASGGSFAYAGAAGLVFGYAAARSCGLEISIGLHAANNVSMLLAILLI